jgi:uncharacterized membrane protein YidH (DUF202 family)
VPRRWPLASTFARHGTVMVLSAGVGGLQKEATAAMSEHSDMTPSAAAGWYADPLGRHERRYWDGAAWTDHIVDGTTQGTDPVSGPPVATGQAAQTASAAPAAVVPATPRPGRSANRVAGCVIAAAGGAAMIAGTYLTWVSASVGIRATGWDYYRMQSQMHAGVFMTAGSMFTKTSPLLTGLTTLIVGIAIVVLALMILALPASQAATGQTRKRDVNPVLAALVLLLAVCALVGGVWNLVTYFTTGPHSGVSAGAGLYVVAAGGIAGLSGLVRAVSHRTVV